MDRVYDQACYASAEELGHQEQRLTKEATTPAIATATWGKKKKRSIRAPQITVGADLQEAET